MQSRCSSKHISIYTFVVAFMLSIFLASFVGMSPVNAADTIGFGGKIESSVPTGDGTTQYGPITVILTNISNPNVNPVPGQTNSEIPTKNAVSDQYQTSTMVLTFSFEGLNK